MKKLDWVIFIEFLFLSFLFRFWSFFVSVIDSDESLYILAAQSIISGQPPYVEVWDNKPPGIFLLFSLAMLIFGDSVTSIRILACLSIALTSYFLYKIGKLLGGEKIGLLSGIFYLIFSLNNDGIAANAEILFSPFVTLAFYIFFNTKYSRFTCLSIGLIIGCAMQIKYVVIMDLFALLLIGTIQINLENHQLKLNKIANFYGFLILGCILPFIVVGAYFISVGHFNEYIYANFIANQKYIDTTEFSLQTLILKSTARIYSNLFLYICLFLVPIYLKYVKLTIKEKRNLLYLTYWFGLTFISTLLSKRFLAHYYIQLLPPLCLISSFVVVTVYIRRERINHLLILFLVLILSLQTVYPQLEKSTLFVTERFIKGKDNWGDQEAVVANYLKPKVNQSDYIYVANYQPIIYYLVPSKLPTKYVFPSHLISYYSSITGINPIQELDSIMNKKPVYVILDDKKNIKEEYKNALDVYLINNYILEKSIENVKLYRLKNNF